MYAKLKKIQSFIGSSMVDTFENNIYLLYTLHGVGFSTMYLIFTIFKIKW